MAGHFCIDALKEIIIKYGVPTIFNTDQGSQFTSKAFTTLLKSYKIRISMNEKGKTMDNIYVERLWRTLKYEELYLNSYDSLVKLRKSVSKYFNFYNKERFHESLDYKIPDEQYYSAFVSAEKVA